MKRTVACAVFVLFLSLSALAQDTVTVISIKANLRGTPATDGIVVSTVDKGDTFELIKEKSPWYLVQTPKYVGWIHGNSIRLHFELPDRSVSEIKPETPLENSDQELKLQIEAEIRKLGIRAITVTVKERDVTLTGSVPKDKFASVLQAAQEARPRKVINNLTFENDDDILPPPQKTRPDKPKTTSKPISMGDSPFREEYVGGDTSKIYISNSSNIILNLNFGGLQFVVAPGGKKPLR